MSCKSLTQTVMYVCNSKVCINGWHEPYSQVLPKILRSEKKVSADLKKQTKQKNSLVSCQKTEALACVMWCDVCESSGLAGSVHRHLKYHRSAKLQLPVQKPCQRGNDWLFHGPLAIASWWFCETLLFTKCRLSAVSKRDILKNFLLTWVLPVVK